MHIHIHMHAYTCLCMHASMHNFSFLFACTICFCLLFAAVLTTKENKYPKIVISFHSKNERDKAYTCLKILRYTIHACMHWKLYKCMNACIENCACMHACMLWKHLDGPMRTFCMHWKRMPVYLLKAYGWMHACMHACMRACNVEGKA